MMSMWEVVKRGVKATPIILFAARVPRPQQMRGVLPVKDIKAFPSRPQPSLHPGAPLSFMTRSGQCTWSACVSLYSPAWPSARSTQVATAPRVRLVVALRIDDRRCEPKICAASPGKNETLCASLLSAMSCEMKRIELTGSLMSETW